MTPLINGISYNWASIQFVLFGVPVVGITSIAYKTKQEKTNNFGAGYVAVSRGYGKKEVEGGNIELYQDEWQKIIAASPNRDPLLVPWFDITVSFGDDIASATTHILQASEFLEDPFEAKQGDTKLMAKIPLIIAQVIK